jgi:hypothetical protein
MKEFMLDNMIQEIIYDAKINVKKYAKIILKLSSVGNINGANYYRNKISEQRRIIKYFSEAY